MEFYYRIGHVTVVHRDVCTAGCFFSSLSFVTEFVNEIREQIHLMSHFYGICYLQRPIMK